MKRIIILSLVLAIIALSIGGCWPGNIDDAKDLNQVIASLDPVAADAYGATLIGVQPQTVEYLSLAAERGLGNAHWDQVSHVEV